ncbi:MAG TPA: BlaI/MecI/CopY family transcriptional regulator [Thermoguttaceae bacterium]|nr:BlaI/MecI/CopY family transcriptional regulator [Thermoguttaceae bacterium]
MKKPRPSDLETQVLSVLWEHGPSTVRQVFSRLPDGKERAYTTILTVLQGMERKRLVSRTRDGAAHIYRAEVDRDEVGEPVVKTLLRNVFAGDPARVVQALVNSAEVNADDLKQIRRVINQAARDMQKAQDMQEGGEEQ